MKLESVKVSKLCNNTGQIEGVPKNPRFIRDNRFKSLVKSIQDDPEMLGLREIVAYNNGKNLIVVCGNMRLAACKDLGYKEVPCKILPKSTPAEKLRAYIMKDNIPFGQDDFDSLGNEWDETELMDFGFEATGLGDEPEEEGEKQSQKKYQLIVTCDNEKDCEDLKEELEDKGYICKIK